MSPKLLLYHFYLMRETSGLFEIFFVRPATSFFGVDFSMPRVGQGLCTILSLLLPICTPPKEKTAHTTGVRARILSFHLGNFNLKSPIRHLTTYCLSILILMPIKNPVMRVSVFELGPSTCSRYRQGVCQLPNNRFSF